MSAIKPIRHSKAVRRGQAADGSAIEALISNFFLESGFMGVQ
ncbi:MAG TPA: hypothetical protein P5038_01000 [Candidatus Paceibacterota bacterium]|nr:hypothetical protein [Candidatus Paceibacterota bacterium]